MTMVNEGSSDVDCGPAKRKADDQPDTDITSKRPRHTKACVVCEIEKAITSFPVVSKNCKSAHSNDTYKLCWQQYIAVEALEHGQEKIECVQYQQCKAHIAYDDLKRIISEKVLGQ